MTNRAFGDNSNPFHISKAKRNGMYIIIFLIALVIFAPRFFMQLSQKDFNVSVHYFKDTLNEKTLKNEKIKEPYQKREMHQEKYHGLDRKRALNSITSEEWKSLGLSEKQALVVVSIVSKGIYNEIELNSIKYIPQELFEKIKDSIIYVQQENNNKYVQKDTVSFSPTINIHELNSSSQQDLVELPGIGNYTAKSIINFREALGGFFSISQLLEVYNMRIENYDKMKNHLSLDTSLIKKININVITYEELSKHPYLSNNQANSIVKMRMQKGGYFQRKEEILESALIDEETFNKLQYYLYIE